MRGTSGYSGVGSAYRGFANDDNYFLGNIQSNGNDIKTPKVNCYISVWSKTESDRAVMLALSALEQYYKRQLIDGYIWTPDYLYDGQLRGATGDNGIE